MRVTYSGNSVCKVLTRENEEDSMIEGLWAVGETACMSLHGANRLGANSLLELLVFGKAIADQIDCMTRPGERHEDLPAVRFTNSRCVANLLWSNAWRALVVIAFLRTSLRRKYTFVFLVQSKDKASMCTFTDIRRTFWLQSTLVRCHSMTE